MNFKSRFRIKYLFITICGTFAASTSFIFFHKQLPIFNSHRLIYENNNNNKFLVSGLGPFDNYRPTFYLPTCILQMLYNEICPNTKVDYKREYIETPDGGLISFDWAVPEREVNETRLIIILHGLTGGSESSYIKEIVKGLMNNESNKVVVVQFRGINGSPLKTPLSYHAGETSDIKFALNYFRKTYPNLACYTVGTSMGANIFVKLFAHDHSFDDYVKGLVSISNPFNIIALEERNRGTVIDYFLKKRQQRYIKQHYNILKTLDRKNLLKTDINIDKLFKIKYHREFDEIFTIKLFNFESVDEYYKKSSCYLDVDKLKIPTFFINSMNDRLSPWDTLNLDLCI